MSQPTHAHVPVMLSEVVAPARPARRRRLSRRHVRRRRLRGGIPARRRPARVWAIDRDPEAIARGASLAARFPGRLHLIQGQFGDMLDLLAEHGVTALDGVVLDLGVSSFQLDDPARGFSFRGDGPLDMRMGRSGPTAADLVNTLPERELADLLFEFGEERASRRIARAIVAARAEAPDRPRRARLAAIIRGVLPPDRSGIDPATRSFQALRIRVNDELGEIERALDQASRLLAPGGRLVVVSFHSLEDRIVKRFMAEAAGRAPAPSRHDPRGLAARPAPRFRLLTARPLRPAPAETAANPRARSARLRALECTPSRSRAMIRPFTCVCFLLACGSGLYLYQSKHRVQMLDREIEKTVRATDELREQTRVLHAEWTLQNDPQRLQVLADQFLSLKTVTPGQFTSMADLDSRLPAVRAPEPAAAGAAAGCRSPTPTQPEEPRRRMPPPIRRRPPKPAGDRRRSAAAAPARAQAAAAASGDRRGAAGAAAGRRSPTPCVAAPVRRAVRRRGSSAAASRRACACADRPVRRSGMARSASVPPPRPMPVSASQWVSNGGGGG